MFNMVYSKNFDLIVQITYVIGPIFIVSILNKQSSHLFTLQGWDKNEQNILCDVTIIWERKLENGFVEDMLFPGNKSFKTWKSIMLADDVIVTAFKVLK